MKPPRAPHPLALRGLATALLAGLAGAGTLVVDDDGPADFADLPAALAAAVPGDLVLVRPGAYSAFELRHGLTLLGEGAGVVQVAGTSRVSGIQEGERAVLAGLDLARLEVSGCAGFVLVQDVRAGSIEATLAVDLRLHGVETRLACALRSARVEALACSFRGARGTSDGAAGGAGIPGLVCSGGARVHLALCDAQGGKGGDGRGEPAQGHRTGGDGGAGILVGPGGEAVQLVLAGAQSRVRGGDNGLGHFCALDGDPGAGLELGERGGSAVRWSGVEFAGGARLCGGRAAPTRIGGGNQLLPLQPEHPTLELLAGTPGAPATLRLRAPEGASARLHLGGEPAIQPVAAGAIQVLVEPSSVLVLGSVPLGGVLDYQLVLPEGLPPGLLVLVQASCTLPGGQVLLTNSAAVILR